MRNKPIGTTRTAFSKRPSRNRSMPTPYHPTSWVIIRGWSFSGRFYCKLGFCIKQKCNHKTRETNIILGTAPYKPYIHTSCTHWSVRVKSIYAHPLYTTRLGPTELFSKVETTIFWRFTAPSNVSSLWDGFVVRNSIMFVENNVGEWNVRLKLSAFSSLSTLIESEIDIEQRASQHCGTPL